MSPAPRDGFDENEHDPRDEEFLGSRMTYRRADTVVPSVPNWLWERWLLAGALHLGVGRQSGGKTTFASWTTGCLSTGRPFPGDTTRRDPIACGILSLEEPG